MLLIIFIQNFMPFMRDVLGTVVVSVFESWQDYVAVLRFFNIDI